MTDHLITQLTYPEFHSEIETEVDSLSGLQGYEGDYFEWILTIFKHKINLNSLGDNFQLEMRLRFLQWVLRSIYAIRNMSVLKKISFH